MVSTKIYMMCLVLASAITLCALMVVASNGDDDVDERPPVERECAKWKPIAKEDINLDDEWRQAWRCYECCHEDLLEKDLAHNSQVGQEYRDGRCFCRWTAWSTMN